MHFFKLIGGFLLRLFGGDLGPELFKSLNRAYEAKLSAKTDLARIVADERIRFWEQRVIEHQSANAEGTNRQKVKMNYWVFWLVLGLAFMPGISTWLLLMVYNVLWHQHGIWPQQWNIAAFPPPYDRYVDMSMEWLFDPIKFATTTGTAIAGGYVTGKRT